MRLIADLHIHSHYSRATSKDLTLEHLARWAQLKGVQVVATGDIAHPGWLEELRVKLVPTEDGLFRLRDDLATAVVSQVPATCRGPVYFLLGGEISNIYKRHDAVRKVHNMVYLPTLDAVAALQRRLESIGNIRADGRPILGLDSRDLLEIVLEIDPRGALIPAHIWTPWFSMLGSKSGFDTVEQCFGDLTPHIFALETGLSSDPPMNWRVANLDRYTLVSNSDAHSPQKLAREATVFTTEPGYDALFDALRSGDPAGFGGTLEFFPEEGKYHLDGHRHCGIVWEPQETLAHDLRCPVCGKEVTVGVMHRVELLADRPPGGKPARTHAYTSLVPLPEVLGEVLGTGAGSRRVQQAYDKLLARLGPELTILLDTPPEEIAALGEARLAEAIGRIRRGEVIARGGYDGEYGVIRVFGPGAAPEGTPQLGLLNEPGPPAPAKGKAAAPDATPPAATAPSPPVASASDLGPLFAKPEVGAPELVAEETVASPPLSPVAWLERLNKDQRAAVRCVDRNLLIVAGPGTGKTRTLTVRLAHLVAHHGVLAQHILALTFTNKAAEEMRARLAALVGEETAAAMTVGTFHALGASLLREVAPLLGLTPDFAIAAEADRLLLLRQALPGLSEREAHIALEAISAAKNRNRDPAADPALATAAQAYGAALRTAQMVDLDDLLLLPLQLLRDHPQVAAQLCARYRFIAVDEYQDVNAVQVELLRHLAAGGANVCAIGDPDQAIYGFRGADHRYFARFAQDFPDAHIVHLQRSYRSPQALLDAARQVIAGGPTRAARQLVSDFGQAVRVDIYTASSDRAEAEYVVHTIERAVGGTSYFSLDSGRVAGDARATRSFGDFAVLYRLNAQNALLVEALERSGIPYQVVGRTPLREAREIRALLALLQLDGPAAPVAAATLLARGSAALDARGLAWLTAAVARTGVDAALAQAVHDGPFTPAQRRCIAGLAALRGALPATGPIAARIPRLFDAWAAWQGETPTPAQQARVRLLCQLAIPYDEQVTPFLERMALEGSADAYDPRADRVTLLTLHAAKGLEFPVVMMVGCEEGLLPYLPPNAPDAAVQPASLDGDPPDEPVAGPGMDIAEERRLFYVGMTRARAQLILTHARRRVLFGATVEPPVSRFVEDIDAALKAVQQQEPRPPQRLRPEGLQLSLF